MALRRDQKTLLAAAIASFALWAIPGMRLFAIPLVYLNTHIHELCHALAAIVTGGVVEKIIVFANGSGVTPIAGGSLLITASAGYVGSAVVGGLMVAGGRSEAGARNALKILGVFLGMSMVFFVRGDLFGLGSGLLWVLTLWLLSNKLKGDHATFAAQFLGVQTALTSLHALLVLLRISTEMETHSDAKILESVTGLPALFWALAWSGLGLIAVVSSLASAWRPATRQHRP